jgi:hypothetical protein
VMGTPAYMSPEQCLGRSGEVDHRTDIYALGVILFEMLCGMPPFVGEGFGEVLVMHMTQPPPAPRGLNPDISVGVEQVILRALAKRKEDRFATMQEMAQAIAASARDPNITFLPATGGPLRSPTPVRPTTTFSAAAGAVEGASAEPGDDELRPATGRRWGLMVVGVGALAAAGAAFFVLGGQRQAPVVESPGQGSPAAAAVVPQLVQPPPPPPAAELAENVAPVPAKVPPPGNDKHDDGKAQGDHTDHSDKAGKADKPDKAGKSRETSKGDKADKSDKAEKSDRPGKSAPSGKPPKPAKRDRDAAPAATGRQLARPPEPEVLSPHAPTLPAPPPETPPAPRPQKLEKL